MRKRNFLQSLNDAADGFIFVVKNERNMRIHFLFGFFVLVLAVWLGINRLDWIILCTIISFVLVTEMINTAIEDVIDLVKTSHHPVVRMIKHVSAGAVLVSSMNALIVGFFIFSKYLPAPFRSVAERARYTPAHVTFFALIAVIFAVIFSKAFFQHGSPFRGGAVSGHSAVAFGIWTAVILVQNNVFVSSAVFLMALLVAQSRLRAKIHSVIEVIAGAALGILVTALFFQLFQKTF